MGVVDVPTRRCARSQERFSTSTKTVSIARVSRMGQAPILRPRSMAQRGGFLPPRPPGAPPEKGSAPCTVGPLDGGRLPLGSVGAVSGDAVRG